MNLTWVLKSVLYTVAIVIVLILSMHFLPNFFVIDIGNYLTIVSFLFLAVGSILLYFQIRTNLSFNKRKAAFDFITTNIPNELIPLYRELTATIQAATVSQLFTNYKVKTILEGNTYSDEQKAKFAKTLLAILNFYERMAIGIYKQVLENDIVYDDIGNNAIQLYPWVRQYVESLQSIHDEERLFVNFETLANQWTKVHAERKTQNNLYNLRLKKRQTIVNKNI